MVVRSRWRLCLLLAGMFIAIACLSMWAATTANQVRFLNGRPFGVIYGRVAVGWKKIGDDLWPQSLRKTPPAPTPKYFGMWRAGIVIELNSAVPLMRGPTVYLSEIHVSLLWIAILLSSPLLWFGRNAFLLIPVGHCPTCGYDLRATPERCPECGREVEPSASIEK